MAPSPLGKACLTRQSYLAGARQVLKWTRVATLRASVQLQAAPIQIAFRRGQLAPLIVALGFGR